jgi:hypothetical protein
MFILPPHRGRQIREVSRSERARSQRGDFYTVTTKGSEQLTAISDADFDLRSVFSEVAEGSQVYVKYIDDAAEEGDTELVEFFKDVQEQEV